MSKCYDARSGIGWQDRDRAWGYESLFSLKLSCHAASNCCGASTGYVPIPLMYLDCCLAPNRMSANIISKVFRFKNKIEERSFDFENNAYTNTDCTGNIHN